MARNENEARVAGRMAERMDKGKVATQPKSVAAIKAADLLGEVTRLFAQDPRPVWAVIVEWARTLDKMVRARAAQSAQPVAPPTGAAPQAGPPGAPAVAQRPAEVGPVAQAA